ncbi:hypothetical protein OSB04_017200 [Centaurea solstitialis]|uniref:Reverse transcriptase domain-containing protein n=1 Tax=Centaurea solstitialis TaxID=347529 RepID=A0AA38T2F8_9ASTR|nr:hypothetical protein OSB04_017200 [Centaurea solstitialis]
MGINLNTVMRRKEDGSGWEWVTEPSKKFTVCSLRRLIDGINLPISNHETDRCCWIPAKVNIHIWRILMNILATKDNLSKRGVSLSSDECPLCLTATESMDHLLVSCSTTKIVTAHMANWVNWWPKNISTTSEIWSLVNTTTNLRLRVCKVIIAAYCWTIWLQRNNKLFNGTCKKEKEIFSEIQYLAFDWIRCCTKFGRLLNCDSWVCNPVDAVTSCTLLAPRYDLGRPRFRSNLFRKLSTEQNKISKMPSGPCGGDKAPGPDEFSFAFVKKYWDLIGTDFVAVVNHFEKAPHLLRGYNDSFTSLVPKSNDPLSLSVYRPIHLVGCICKVISKVLANRLSKVIGSVISPEQTAYVDFEKAFDNLNWEFLFGTLEQMGFGKIWIGWVKGLIGSARVSVLVNGSPTPQFPLQKGVRQGDPLSMYLFIISVEGLIAYLKDAVAKGLIIGVNLPDDAIIMGKWDDNNISNHMKLLRCFHKASGLMVNWCKSTLTGIGVSNSEVARLANPQP